MEEEETKKRGVRVRDVKVVQQEIYKKRRLQDYERERSKQFRRRDLQKMEIYRDNVCVRVRERERDVLKQFKKFRGREREGKRTFSP